MGEAVSGGMRRNDEDWGNWNRLSRELGIVRESFHRLPPSSKYHHFKF
jgi:hypothetical protein